MFKLLSKQVGIKNKGTENRVAFGLKLSAIGLDWWRKSSMRGERETYFSSWDHTAVEAARFILGEIPHSADDVAALAASLDEWTSEIVAYRENLVIKPKRPRAEPKPKRGSLASLDRCPDCGKTGERKGHMGCQYPQ